MKKNSHKRWSFFLCLLMVLSLTAVGCEKKCSDDEIFVPDQEQTEGEGDAADTQDTANAEEPAAEPETQTPDSVPEAYRETVDHPVFRAEDMSRAVVEARAYTPNELGDTNSLRIGFAVLHLDGTLVDYSCEGLSVEQVWDMVSGTLS